MAQVDAAPALFGSETRTATLVAIRLLGQTWASELALLLGQRLFSVQRVLSAFERERVIVLRKQGSTRIVTLNPRYFAAKELDALLWKLGQADAGLQKQLAANRRRPRETGRTAA